MSLGTACVWGGILASPHVGCTTHQCDPTSIPLSAAAQAGLSELTNDLNGFGCLREDDAGFDNQPTYVQNGSELMWQSSPLLGTWFSFGGLATITFTLPEVFSHAEIYDISTNVATAPDPWCVDGSTFAPAAGNLAEVWNVTHVGDAGLLTFSITNATCQQYYAHVVVRAAVNDGTFVPADAGLDATLGTSLDGGLDASLDAPADSDVDATLGASVDASADAGGQ